MKFTEYITSEGERWDTIAFKAYGDATKFQKIIESNPSVSVTSRLEAGIRLVVPIIEVQPTAEKSLLPPWKRVKTPAEITAANSVNNFNNIATEIQGSFDEGSFD